MLAIVLSLSVLIGVSLGMLGGGGSILSVPILTYVAGLPPAAAIAASLVVVGVTSVVGAIAHARAGRVRWRTGAIFGAAGMVGAFVGSRIGALLPDRVLIVSFAVVMAVTAVAMLRRRRELQCRQGDLPLGASLALGVGFGAITGLVGAGGGFLVVPALVLVGGLAMPNAVGTSLVIIAMSSTAGLIGHLGQVELDWPLTLAVTGFAVGGSLVGSRLTAVVPPATLRRGFGIFVIVLAAFVLMKEIVL